MENGRVEADKTAQEKTYTEAEVRKLVEGFKSQNAQLIYQLQNTNMNNLFKRLDYLFKVIENATMFDEAFVEQCITEIKELMTPPAETEENKE